MHAAPSSRKAGVLTGLDRVLPLYILRWCRSIELVTRLSTSSKSIGIAVREDEDEAKKTTKKWRGRSNQMEKQAMRASKDG
jgi:hypothetical protein